MKKIFFLSAIALGLMTSCSEDEQLSLPSVDNNTIAFATQPANKPITRSGATITSLSEFTVDAVNTDNTAFFSSVLYVYDNTQGFFISSTPYYWPTTNTLSFYAISDPGTVSRDANKVPHYAYTDWAGEKDLVAATVLAGEKTIPYPLTFQHLLSQISVSADAKDKTENLIYKVTSIEMSAPCDGTYSFADATGGVGLWEINNNSSKEYSFKNALPQSFNESASISSGTTYWNILPIKDGRIKFTVGYQVFQNNKMIADFSGDKAKECVVVNPNLMSGKRYVYNFKLTRGTNDVITFSTSIIGWNDTEDSVDLMVPDDNDEDLITPKPIAGSTTSINTEAGVNLYESEEYDWKASYSSDKLSLLAMNTSDLSVGDGKFNYAEVDIDGTIYTVKVIDYYFEPIKTTSGDTIEIRIGNNIWYANCCGENYAQKSSSSHTVKLIGCIVNGISYQIECD